MSNHLFAKLAAQESKFKNVKFLSPVLRGQKVRVRIAEIVMSLSIDEPKRFQGWGVFQPTSYTSAKFVREPSLAERSNYLNLFPVIRLVASYRKNRIWFGVPATQSDARFGIGDAIPISLSDGFEKFDTVITRFDGQRCWFEKLDPRRSVRISKQLRESLRDHIAPEVLSIADCTPTERTVYENSLLFALEAKHRAKFARMDRDEVRIREALQRGGGNYQSHREIGESFTVTYEVNGHAHHSTVDKHSLSVQSAGICLDGFDANFDLQSLVGVLIEGHETGQINRV
jgi:hypothetical protein